jgi:hypothetical protein
MPLISHATLPVSFLSLKYIPALVGDVFPMPHPDAYSLAKVDFDNMICRPCSSWHLWVPQRNEFELLQAGDSLGGAAVHAIARWCTVANGLESCEDAALRRDVDWICVFGAHRFEDCLDIGFGGEGYRKSGGLSWRWWGQPSAKQCNDAKWEGAHIKHVKGWWRQRGILWVIIRLAGLVLILCIFENLDESQMVLDDLPRRTRRLKSIFDGIELELGVLKDVGSASLAWNAESVERAGGVGEGVALSKWWNTCIDGGQDGYGSWIGIWRSFVVQDSQYPILVDWREEK